LAVNQNAAGSSPAAGAKELLGLPESFFLL